MNYSSKFSYPTAYFADLDAYNNGELRGVHIEFYDGITPDEVMEEIEDMLKDSDGDEWAVHDTEGFGDLVSEYTSIEKMCDLAELINRYSENAVAGFVARVGLDYLNEFEQAYIGRYSSEENFVEEHFSYIFEQVDDIMLPGGSPLSGFIDTAAIANDCFCGDYYSYAPHYDECHVYHIV